MEDLQELQDLQNQKIEQLEEKLKELNKVSFNEYESESINSPVEKKRKLENHVVKKLIYQMKNKRQK